MYNIDNLINLMKENNINTLDKFMNNEDVMHIVEQWHGLDEFECGEKLDYEQYLIDCYELTQMK